MPALKVYARLDRLEGCKTYCHRCLGACRRVEHALRDQGAIACPGIVRRGNKIGQHVAKSPWSHAVLLQQCQCPSREIQHLVAAAQTGSGKCVSCGLGFRGLDITRQGCALWPIIRLVLLHEYYSNAIVLTMSRTTLRLRLALTSMMRLHRWMSCQRPKAFNSTNALMALLFIMQCRLC